MHNAIFYCYLSLCYTLWNWYSEHCTYFVVTEQLARRLFSWHVSVLLRIVSNCSVLRLSGKTGISYQNIAMMQSIYMSFATQSPVARLRTTTAEWSCKCIRMCWGVFYMDDALMTQNDTSRNVVSTIVDQMQSRRQGDSCGTYHRHPKIVI